MHSTALGKAILANLPEFQLNELIQLHGLSRHNSNTIHSEEQLRDHLRTIRYRGFALDNEEDQLGYRHVASPIFNQASHVVGAVDVAGTRDQVSGENLADLADLVKDAGAGISSIRGTGIHSISDSRDEIRNLKFGV